MKNVFKCDVYMTHCLFIYKLNKIIYIILFIYCLYLLQSATKVILEPMGSTPVLPVLLASMHPVWHLQPVLIVQPPVIQHSTLLLLMPRIVVSISAFIFFLGGGGLRQLKGCLWGGGSMKICIQSGIGDMYRLYSYQSYNSQYNFN